MYKSLKRFICIMLTMCFVLHPAFYVQAEEAPVKWMQFKQVNPIYEGIISEEDLDDAATDLSEMSLERKSRSGEYTDDMEQIAAQLRQAMVKRQKVVAVKYYLENGLESENQFNQIVNTMREKALEETANPKEGDYIRYHLAGWDVQAFFDSTGRKVDFTFTLTYYTTTEQEEAVDKKLQTVLWETLNLDDASLTNYEKTKKIYDYICDNVTYDYEHLDNPDYGLQFSAYAALINGTSVCQGYASLLYRMLEEAGVDSRVVVGIAGEPHGWNIARLGDKYYYLDATWDAGVRSYAYFLKGYTKFEKDHTPMHESVVYEDPYANVLSATDFIPGQSDNSDYGEGPDIPSDHIHSLVKVAAKAATCTAAGRIEHYKCKECNSVFEDADGTIKLRGADVTISAKGHAYGAYKRVTKASFGKAGKRVATCSRCGGKKSKKITAAASPKLSKTSYVFNNKMRYPSVIVNDTKGIPLSYYATMEMGKNVGKYAVKVKLTDEDYTGTKTVYYKINPKGVAISSLTKGTKAFTVKWKKPTAVYRNQMTGYQIRYSTSSKMTNAKSITVKSTTATSKKISNLKAKKNYYVQIRTYKKIGSVYYYSGWSSTKKVRTN